MKNLRIIIYVAIALVAAGIFGRGLLHRGDYAVAAGADMDPPAAWSDSRPNLVAATFYSAWCGSCAILDPKLRDVAPEFEGRAVEFVKFDFSLGQPEALTAKAEALGVERVYLANKGATGFMALIDRRTQRVVGDIRMDQDKAQIRASIDAAIRAISEPAV